jgi:6-phosphogluconolactonase
VTVSVHVVRDAELLAAAAGARLLLALADAQAARGRAEVVLTGGGVGIALLEQAAASPLLDVVDWRTVDVWWGDERFVPADDEERNELQSRRALLDRLDLDPGRVHPAPALGGPDGDDVDAAAARYAAELAAAGFGPDVLLLGVGDDGHTASLFPGHPATGDDRLAVGVREAPKPPPTRISLGHGALASARETWFVVAGAAKAHVVARALREDDPEGLPPSAVRGREATRWLLDEAAASALARP